ncbi:MAG: hypothetical protein HYS33_00900, partial [Acidobacteria bacterium]|nr:hypothetical protein [Acidobacteriota bacterium]
MRRKAILSLTVICLILGMVTVAAPGETPGPTRAALKAVTLAGPPSGGEVLLRIEGDFSYRTIQATDSALWVDLQGVMADGVPRTGQWTGGLLDGFRVLQFTDASGQPVVRVQIDVGRGGPVTAKREADGLRLSFEASPAPKPAVTVAPAPLAAPPKTETTVTYPAPDPVSSGLAKVSGVNIKTGEAGETVVEIRTSRKLPYNVF